MFVDTAYFIFYMTNKKVLKRTIKCDPLFLWWPIQTLLKCLNEVSSCFSVASLTHFDASKNKLTGKAFCCPGWVFRRRRSFRWHNFLFFFVIQKKPSGGRPSLTNLGGHIFGPTRLKHESHEGCAVCLAVLD